MVDRAELKLAEGSRWVDNSTVVNSSTVENASDFARVELANFIEVGDAYRAWLVPILDALAVIRAAGLDPEFTELQRCKAHLARLGYAAVEIARITSGNEIESDMIAPTMIPVQVLLYDEAFTAGVHAAESAIGLNCTRPVTPENPYRMQFKLRARRDSGD